jgi:hypothetical protein
MTAEMISEKIMVKMRNEVSLSRRTGILSASIFFCSRGNGWRQTRGVCSPFQLHSYGLAEQILERVEYELRALLRREDPGRRAYAARDQPWMVKDSRVPARSIRVPAHSG